MKSHGQPEPIEHRILLIRGRRVMIDADLAVVYGVSTKRLNQQVRRNRLRFPPDFMFQLTPIEKATLVDRCGHLRKLRFSPNLPAAFTEHGTLMLANVLKSPSAIGASIQVVRAFIRLREMLSAHRELARRLDELERRYDSQFKTVFDAIRILMGPSSPDEPPRKIGFDPGGG